MVRTMAKVRRKVYQYTAFFDRNELGGYTVTVPALPGLVTEGEDLEHARSMAEDAIRCYIEGLPSRRRSLSLGRLSPENSQVYPGSG